MVSGSPILLSASYEAMAVHVRVPSEPADCSPSVAQCEASVASRMPYIIVKLLRYQICELPAIALTRAGVTGTMWVKTKVSGILPNTPLAVSLSEIPNLGGDSIHVITG